MKLIIVILFSTFLFSEQGYPADSLIKSNSISITKKLGILPIALWQRLSYNTNTFNCQFYPSCSNYGSKSITNYGFFRGSIVALDRITRCNPFASHYHLKLKRPFYEKDGRLIDTIKQSNHNSSLKNAYFAGFLSAVIPGLGRIYAGRIMDGILGFTTVVIFGNSTFNTFNNQQLTKGTFLGIATIFLYGSEIYGAWRTAKYYQKNEPMS